MYIFCEPTMHYERFESWIIRWSTLWKISDVLLFAGRILWMMRKMWKIRIRSLPKVQVERIWAESKFLVSMKTVMNCIFLDFRRVSTKKRWEKFYGSIILKRAAWLLKLVREVKILHSFLSTSWTLACKPWPNCKRSRIWSDFTPNYRMDAEGR